ncbi:MAG: 50S ribosomal protein L29 [Bacteroidota bacterium]|nr:50S ribosomal protein L29 [Bacteroidota bacterium]MDP4231106.1 50S ribosomal protein L29 [Bacteroidota bacterium]MDP4236866.1 50S ribosomal protein L29 [Bacteroidota bacterium]
MKSTHAAELRGRENGEIKRQISENISRLTALNFQKVTGHLENSAQIRTLKRDIARMKTVLHERETETKS